MHTVTVNKTIDVPAQDVWEALDDFGGIYRFHPLIETSPIVNDVPRGEGAKRECTFYSGGSIKERITDYEPGRSYTVDIYDNGPFPLKQSVSTITIEHAGSGRTDVDWKLDFEPKYGPAGDLMAYTVMKRQFRSILDSLIDSLEEYLRTGKLVGGKGATR